MKIATEQTQVLILGQIDRFNYFQICEECHKIREDLPIVLISRQKVVDVFFRRLAYGWGAIDVITNNQIDLDRVFTGLERPIVRQLPNESQIQRKFSIPGQSVLIGLREIAAITNNYFGPLAQGNYWRKAHSRIVNEFPFVLNWSVDHFGKFSCEERILTTKLTVQEIYSLRIWVQMFIKECDRTIVNFEDILNNSDISPPAKYLLAQF
jgi:hypothetical protein